MPISRNLYMPLMLLAIALCSPFETGFTQEANPETAFPVSPTVFVDEPFNGCEGIAFNGEGRLFVTCDRALWEISVTGDVRQVADLYTNLGVAGVGGKDLLVADFGPTNAFRQERNSDGIVWRITPDGEMTEHALGIGDPNFIVVRRDGTYLVSDDATNEVFVVDSEGEVKLFTTAVNHPNGLALSADESTLYIAQIFSSIRPVVMDNALWALPLVDGGPIRGARLAARLDPGAAVDGLAIDEQGRVYVAANAAGRLWRYDPRSEELTVIAEGMFGIASLAFGEGDFDHQSLYATATYSQGRGGKIWQIHVGVRGAELNR